MRHCTETSPIRKRIAAAAVLAAVLMPLSAFAQTQTGPPPVKLALLLKNGAAYLRRQQNANGSFGRVQPHLQTSLVMLALLSRSARLSPEDAAIVRRAAAYLVEDSSARGDLGDEAFNTESHAIASVALLCALDHISDPEQRAEAAKRLYRAFRHTQRIQDRSSMPPSRGGWKMEGSKGRLNDRRASAWALLSYFAGRQYGIEVDDSKLERGIRFMMGAFKTQSDTAEDGSDQLGGFSVDAQGLAVDLISSMGGWMLVRFDQQADAIEKNQQWLMRHPPVWSGPNYFYTNFFRVRSLKFAQPGSPAYARVRQSLFAQISDHQQADGSITFPPGNAQNTVAMGGTFSTAMAILILNVEESRLPFDEDYRVRPLF